MTSPIRVLNASKLPSAEILRLRADGFDLADRCNHCGETLRGVPHKGCDDILATATGILKPREAADVGA